MRAKLVTATVLACVLPISIASAGEGGATIASAPDLQSGVTVHGGTEGTNVEFWRLTLGAGDRVLFRYRNSESRRTEIFVFAPTVNDFNIRDSRYVFYDFGDIHEKAWVAPSPGRWIVKGYSSRGSTYELTAYVQTFTATRVQAPRAIGARARLAVRGTVSGGATGNVAQTIAGNGIRRQAAVPIRGGRFSWTGKINGKPGRYRLTAVYPGDDSHRPSRASITIQAL